jgi:hypothetical protein
MSEREKPFTVNDRRHFTPEGRARDEGPGPADAGAGSAPVSAAAVPRPEPSGTAGGASPSAGESSATGPRRSGPAAGAPVDFGPFLLSLGAQAGLLLGAERGAEGEADALEGARQIISILEMLQDKTDGRRTGEESRILEELLFQLRMAYVDRARRG